MHHADIRVISRFLEIRKLSGILLQTASDIAERETGRNVGGNPETKIPKLSPNKPSSDLIPVPFPPPPLPLPPEAPPPMRITEKPVHLCLARRHPRGPLGLYSHRRIQYFCFLTCILIAYPKDPLGWKNFQ